MPRLAPQQETRQSASLVSYQGIALQVAEKLDLTLRFWVAQRFSAAVTALL
ncbi:MAG: hypothetical protein LAO30_25170 [Acidobacteriia bacterium]|nr:hypothetical protein [Terriglobia bacterium]